MRIAVISALLFLTIGLAFLSYPGIQNDEALFAVQKYFPLYAFHGVPVMALNYLGALKTWIYIPIFALWPPSAMSLRLPVLLLGAGTVAMLCRFLEKTCGRNAAIVGALLLATDPVFLLTTTFDWGPVALQHFFLVACLFSAFLFHTTEKKVWLFCLFFCAGLALWDKALWMWVFTGMAIATVCVFPRQLWAKVTARNLAIAAGAFLLGASPFVVFNVENPLETFRSNSKFTFADLKQKGQVLLTTANGSSLFGYLVRGDGEGRALGTVTPIEKVSIQIGGLTGQLHEDLMPWAVACAVAGIWFTGSTRRLCLFAVICGFTAWGQMAVTVGAGGAAHHAILLWPLPQILIAGVFGKADKRILYFIGTVLVAGNLLVLNQYLTQFIRNGSPSGWSDATSTLTREIGHYPGRRIIMTDWGLFTPIEIVHGDHILPQIADGLFLPQGGTEAEYEYVFRDPSAIWVSHTPEAEVYTGIHARMLKRIREHGHQVRLIETIQDRNGRGIYELFQVQ